MRTTSKRSSDCNSASSRSRAHSAGIDPRRARQRQQRAITVEARVGAGRAEPIERVVQSLAEHGGHGRRAVAAAQPARVGCQARGDRVARRAHPIPALPVLARLRLQVRQRRQMGLDRRAVGEPGAEITRAARARAGEQARPAAGSRSRAPAPPARARREARRPRGRTHPAAARPRSAGSSARRCRAASRARCSKLSIGSGTNCSSGAPSVPRASAHGSSVVAGGAASHPGAASSAAGPRMSSTRSTINVAQFRRKK